MLLSVIVPALNEENYIENCIHSIASGLSNFGENEKEILVIDGLSQDKTLQKLNELKNKYKFLKVHKNEKKTAPSALNIAIKNSSGKYIIRCDAHAYYPENYFTKCLEVIQSSDDNVMNIGGYVKTASKKDTLISNTISQVLSNPIGVGNSHFRIKKKNTSLNTEELVEVDTVPFGCFKKEIFDKIGDFNENEPGNEDLEFNKRIINAGYKILMSKEIYSTYYSRATYSKFISQTFNNGWVTTKNKDFSFRSLRHYVPFLFFLFLLSSLINSLFINNYAYKYLSFLITIAYLFLIFLGSMLNFYWSKKITVFFASFFIFFSLHLVYGLGSFVGLFNLQKNKKINSYEEFLKIAFPTKNPYLRKDKGLFTNTIKYISLRISYFFYISKINANMIDYFSSIVFLIGTYFGYKFLFVDKNFIFGLVLYFSYGLVMFIDFIDGQLARVNEKYMFGNEVDNFNPDLVRFILILLPGLVCEYRELVILTLFCSVLQSTFYYKCRDVMKDTFPKFMKTYFFFHGLRFLFLIMAPILLILFSTSLINLNMISLPLAIFYFSMNAIFFILASRIK